MQRLRPLAARKHRGSRLAFAHCITVAAGRKKRRTLDARILTCLPSRTFFSLVDFFLKTNKKVTHGDIR